MSAICGLVRFGGAPVDPRDVDAMRQAMLRWGPDGGVWIEGSAGFAQLVAHHRPEAHHERGPLVRANGAIITAAARLDNRDELLDRFDLDDAGTPDGELVARAYDAWREDAPLHLFGDWAFAAWHPRDRRLFLARDHYGNTAMHYLADGRQFAFASSLRAVLAVPGVPRRLNELRLSQLLSLWTYDGRSTIYEGLFRLPPACVITLRDDTVHTRQYWRLDDAPALAPASDEEYVARFLDRFTAAVRVRLRTASPIASHLSAGLDSGAVTSIAARLLAGRNTRLTALTSIPIYERDASRELHKTGDAINEWPDAQRTAAAHANVDHVAVPAGAITPLAGVRRVLDRDGQPDIGAINAYWILAAFDEMRRRGCGALLTGQMGNFTVSWRGPRDAAWRAARRLHPLEAWAWMRGWRHRHQLSWPRTVWHTVVQPMRERGTALRCRVRGVPFDPGPFIQPAFASRLDLARRAREEGWLLRMATGSARDLRFGPFVPGLSPAGGLLHQSAAPEGIDVLDPTADVRLVELCYRLPDRLFAREGIDRWVMRQAMRGILPEEVRLSARRGRQAADLAYRLRADADATSAAIETVAASPHCREYLNVAQVQAWWRTVCDPAEARPSKAAFDLVSALPAALFLAGLDD